MSEAESRAELLDPKDATAQALRELLVIRESLIVSGNRLREHRSAARKLRRAQRAIERQIHSLIADLVGFGAGSVEVSALIAEAKELGAERGKLEG